MKNTWSMAVAAMLFATVAAGCKHSEPNFIFMPDMYYSPALKAQEEGGMRTPVKGTVPRGFTPYDFAVENNEELGRKLVNPLQRTKSVMLRGQQQYNTYCIVCHGAYGEGDGSVVPKMPRPPSLQTEKVQSWPDGRIFHVISAGQNVMPSYASQITQEDRWAIVHYIRALQRAKNPSEADLKTAEAR
jgi:mono/diheme cytochrome c family protein